MLTLLFLQETWLKKSDGAIISEIKEYGYHTMMFSKPRKNWGGGVAIIYKSNLNVDRVPNKIKYKSFEHIECVIRTEREVFRVANIYRNEYSKKHQYSASDFIEEFEDYVSNMISKPGTPILVGDYNFHVENPEVDKEAGLFLRTLDSYQLIQTVDGPTHEREGTLDLIISSDKSIIKNIDIQEDHRGSSDHYPIMFNIHCVPSYRNTKINVTTRKWKNLDVNAFKENILACDFIRCPEKTLSLEELVDGYSKTLSAILNKLCPEQHKTVRPRPLQAWFNEELRQLKRNKRSAERNWKKLRSPTNKEKYQTIKKLYHSAIKLARLNFYKKSLLKDKLDIKQVYKTVNRLTGDDFSSTLPTHSDKTVLANNMSDFFSSKIENIRMDITNENEKNVMETPIIDERPPCNAVLENFSMISPQELKNVICSMNNKSNPRDPIPTWLVKECVDELSPVIMMIIEKSLNQAEFPMNLKHATIRPLIKDTDVDPELLNNYRPISNTPFLAKLLEKVALSQLNVHIEDNDLHSTYQSGYKKFHSCETALLKMTNDMITSIENNNMVSLVLLDLSAAFDTVDHDILINRLHVDFGISGNVLKWLMSYLTGRTFAVIIGSNEGDSKILYYGVPQGSLLGPLLFILYTDELSKIAAKHGLSIHIYADDTQLYIGFRPFSEHTDTINRITSCLHDIKTWMFSNFLKLNVSKTKALLIGSKGNTIFHPKINLDYDNQLIENPSDGYVKTLGVLYDKNLSMEKQVSEICKVCYFHLRRLGRIRNYLDIELKILLIKSYILSKLDYCNIILANISDKLIKCMQRVQNAAVRFIYNIKKSEHISQYVKMAHFLPIKFRIQYKMCLITFKILNGLSPVYLQDFIQLHTPKRTHLRTDCDRYRLQVPSKYSNTISYKMIMLWNALPYTLRAMDSLAVFKKHLKTYFYNLAFNE